MKGEIPYSESLAEALAKLNILEIPHSALISVADPDLARIARTYEVVNDDLRQHILPSQYPLIQHATRVARVLLDSSHRRIMQQAAQLQAQPQLIYSGSSAQPGRASAWSFLAACRSHWSILTWADLIDLLFLGADGGFELVAAIEAIPDFFSVFGTDRVLLQSPSDAPTLRKYVWYLQSEHLAEQLRAVFEGLRDGDQVVPAASFRRVLRWLLDGEAAEFALSALQSPQGESEFVDADRTTDWRLRMLGMWRRSVTPGGPPRALTSLGRDWLGGTTNADS